jgi:integrase
VAAGELRRSPADRVGTPRVVAKPDRDGEIKAWTEEEAQQFLRSITGHRWAGPIRLALLDGLRRSELLGLSWSSVDLKQGAVRIDRGLIEVHGRPVWSDGKNVRSRRTFSIDPSRSKALAAHRRFQAEERLAAGTNWVDNNLVVASKTGTPVSPRQLRPDARAARRQGRRAALDFAWAAPHGGDAHGPPRRGHRRDARRSRPARAQPGRADEDVRPRSRSRFAP